MQCIYGKQYSSEMVTHKHKGYKGINNQIYHRVSSLAENTLRDTYLIMKAIPR